MRHFSIFACVAIALGLVTAPAPARQSQSFTLDDMAWVTGSWTGLGPNDFSGALRIQAIWTPALEGVMSYTFSFHKPADNHVHYAFMVLQEVDGGVTLRGIHRAPDFTNYEDTHWTYRMRSASDTRVEFECISGCTKTLSFEMNSDSEMVQQYIVPSTGEATVIMKFKRDDE